LAESRYRGVATAPEYYQFADVKHAELPKKTTVKSVPRYLLLEKRGCCSTATSLETQSLVSSLYGLIMPVGCARV
jgi:hypothetical protein